MTDHTDLIRRLEEAEAGSRRLDVAVHDALFPPRADGYQMPDGTVLPPSWGRGFDDPPYTTSLDAALALVERVLPGAEVIAISRTRTGGWGSGVNGHVAYAATPALALVIATLRALQKGSDQ